MAAAYAAVAAGGRYCVPYAVGSARAGDGRSLPVAGQRCAQVVSQGVADTAAQILTHVIAGPGGHTGARAAIGRPAAGKTGTTNGYGAAWFDGFTPQLASAVWVGDPRGLVPGLNDVRLDGRFWPQVFGGDLPAMIWAATMRRALAGRPALPFAAADPTVVRGARLRVPDVSALSPSAALAAMEAAGVQAEIAPREVTSARPAGTVAYTSPRAGTLVGLDTTVEIYLSAGPPPVTPSPSVSPSVSPTASGSVSPSVSPAPSVSPSPSGSPSPSPSGSSSPTPTPSP
jgi:membrane peptidoglycan carboxypeptidase